MTAQRSRHARLWISESTLSRRAAKPPLCAAKSPYSTSIATDTLDADSIPGAQQGALFAGGSMIQLVQPRHFRH